MELFLVKRETASLLDGIYTEILGVFSCKEKAKSAIENQFDFEYFTTVNTRNNCWKYVFDGELTYYYLIEEIILDKFIYED